MNTKLLLWVLAIVAMIGIALLLINGVKEKTSLPKNLAPETKSSEYTFSFSANPSIVATDEASVLTWNAPSGSECSLAQGSLNGNYTSIATFLKEKGTYTVYPTRSDVYSLSCRPKGGTVADMRIKEVSVAIKGVTLSSAPTEGISPLQVSITGTVAVFEDEPRNVIVFFGDGTSDLMFRKGSELFQETWTHSYEKPRTYEVILVKTTQANIDGDTEVMQNPYNPKNTILAKTIVLVK